MNSVEIFTWADEDEGNVCSIMNVIDNVIPYANNHWQYNHNESISGILIQDVVSSDDYDDIGVKHNNCILFNQGCIRRFAMRVPLGDTKYNIFLDYRVLNPLCGLAYGCEFILYAVETLSGTMYRCNIRALDLDAVERINRRNTIHAIRRLRPQ